MNIHEKYLEIISKCKFVSKPGEWFVEGTEVKLDTSVIYPEYKINDKFNAVCGLFEGYTMETYLGYNGELPREDGETCSFDEFLIYDEHGNEISELTIDEYENKLFCSCGGVNHANHILGEGNCFIEEAKGKYIPTNFRFEKWFDNWKEPYEVCDVNGYSITVWTLINQRGYSKHLDGRWSLPKSHDSLISIGENW